MPWKTLFRANAFCKSGISVSPVPHFLLLFFCPLWPKLNLFLSDAELFWFASNKAEYSSKILEPYLKSLFLKRFLSFIICHQINIMPLFKRPAQFWDPSSSGRQGEAICHETPVGQGWFPQGCHWQIKGAPGLKTSKTIAAHPHRPAVFLPLEDSSWVMQPPGAFHSRSKNKTALPFL